MTELAVTVQPAKSTRSITSSPAAGMPLGYVPPTAPAVDGNSSMPRKVVSGPPPPVVSQAPRTAGVPPPPASPTAPQEPGPEAGESLLLPKKIGS